MAEGSLDSSDEILAEIGSDPYSAFKPWLLYVKENAFIINQGERIARDYYESSSINSNLNPSINPNNMKCDIDCSLITGLNTQASKLNHGIRSYDHSAKSYISPNMLLSTPNSSVIRSDTDQEDIIAEEDGNGNHPNLKVLSLYPMGLNHAECMECHRVIIYSNAKGLDSMKLDKGCKYCSSENYLKIMKISNHDLMLNLNLLILDVLKDWTEDSKKYPFIYLGFADYALVNPESCSENNVNFNPFSFNNPTTSELSGQTVDYSIKGRPVFTVLQGNILYAYDIKRQSGKKKYKNLNGFPIDLSTVRIEEDEKSDRIINFPSLEAPFKLQYVSKGIKSRWERLFQQTLRSQGHQNFLHHSSIHLLASEVVNETERNNISHENENELENDNHNNNPDSNSDEVGNLVGFYSSDELNQQEDVEDEKQNDGESAPSSSNGGSSNALESEEALDSDDQSLTLLVKIIPFHGMPILDQCLWKIQRIDEKTGMLNHRHRNLQSQQNNRTTADETRSIVQFKQKADSSKKLLKALETFLQAPRSEKEKSSSHQYDHERIRAFDKFCNEAFPFLKITK